MLVPPGCTMMRAAVAPLGRATASTMSCPLKFQALPSRISICTGAFGRSTTLPTHVPSSSSPRLPLALVLMRAASTATAASTTTAAGTPSHGSVPTPPPRQQLTWDSFFRLRTVRRRYQLAFSVVGLVTGTGAGLVSLASGVADSVVAVIPVDPMISMGLVAVACGALGWLGGPSLGSALFNLIHRGKMKKAQMMAKETEFFARVKRHRVDPSSSSTANPVPDFYGERIQSVRGYRQWLRDQRAFNKKRRTYL